MIQISDTVKHLIIINVLFFAASWFLPQFHLDDLLNLHYWENPMFQPWQLATSMFMHGGITHLLFNMMGLYFFGTPLEQMWGKQKFLFFYFSAGIGASLIYMATQHFEFVTAMNQMYELGATKAEVFELFNINKIYSNEHLQQANGVFNIQMLGASGAIFGLLAAFGWNFPDAKMFLIFLPVPIAAKYFIPVLVLADLFSGLTGQPILSPVNTAYFAHVGGALIGFIIAYIWKKNQHRTF